MSLISTVHSNCKAEYHSTNFKLWYPVVLLQYTREEEIQPVSAAAIEHIGHWTYTVQGDQLKSGPYFNISNLFTTCYITQLF
jgi:hypothetical protein